jgi:hypothetical protein
LGDYAKTPFGHFFHPPNIAHKGKECDRMGRRFGNIVLGVGRGARKEREGEGSKPNEKVRERDKEGREKKRGARGVGLGFSAHPHE